VRLDQLCHKLNAIIRKPSRLSFPIGSSKLEVSDGI
jgi:hypothetical protein